jgi:Ni,Fe-hydrogenase III component G
MNTDLALQTAVSLLENWSITSKKPEPERLDITLTVEDLLPAVTELAKQHWGYLAAITGLDLGAEAGQIELLYQFCEGAAVLTLRVTLPRENPSVPSIQEIVPSVSFYERELIEMYGITIVGASNTDRLFLPDEWPQNVYPLRKDFTGLEKHESAPK